MNRQNNMNSNQSFLSRNSNTGTSFFRPNQGNSSMNTNMNMNNRWSNNKPSSFFGNSKSTMNTSTFQLNNKLGNSGFNQMGNKPSFFSQNQRSTFMNNANKGGNSFFSNPNQTNTGLSGNNQNSFFKNSTTGGWIMSFFNTGNKNMQSGNSSFFNNKPPQSSFLNTGNQYGTNNMNMTSTTNSFFNQRPMTGNTNSFFTKNNNMTKANTMNNYGMQNNNYGLQTTFTQQNNPYFNQNVNPNIPGNMNPILNSFISGLMMNISNDDSESKEKIKKGQIEILEGVIQSIKKSGEKESEDPDLKDIGIIKNKEIDSDLQRLIRTLNDNDYEYVQRKGYKQNDYNISTISHDENIYTDKWVKANNNFRTIRSYKNENKSNKKNRIINKPNSFISKSNNSFFNETRVDDTKIISLDILVNYSNFSMLLCNHDVNPNCNIDLFINGILRKIKIDWNMMAKVKESATIFFDNKSYKWSKKLKNIKSIKSTRIVLNLNYSKKALDGNIFLFIFF